MRTNFDNTIAGMLRNKAKSSDMYTETQVQQWFFSLIAKAPATFGKFNEFAAAVAEQKVPIKQ